MYGLKRISETIMQDVKTPTLDTNITTDKTKVVQGGGQWATQQEWPDPTPINKHNTLKSWITIMCEGGWLVCCNHMTDGG